MMPAMPYANSAATSAEGPVARIMYASVATFHGSIYAEMGKIRASAVRNNEPAGVATALLYQAGWFVQWKEGPGEALLRIMDRVAGDARHRDLRIVHSSRGPRLLDGPWSMAVVHCADSPADMHHRLLLLRQHLEQGTQFSPPAIWRRLSTPLRHPGALRQQDPDAFQRVVACAAAGTASFDLVKWVAARHGEEVVCNRFFGKHDLDVGTDYVDLVYGERVLRLMAMARNGLQLPLTRAFLADYSHILLLLCGQPERDRALVEKVAQACAAMQHPPALLAVARQAQWHEAPRALARRHRLAWLQVVADAGDPAATWMAFAPLLRGWQQGADAHWQLPRGAGAASPAAGQEDAAIDLADVRAAAERH